MYVIKISVETIVSISKCLELNNAHFLHIINVMYKNTTSRCLNIINLSQTKFLEYQDLMPLSKLCQIQQLVLLWLCLKKYILFYL